MRRGLLARLLLSRGGRPAIKRESCVSRLVADLVLGIVDEVPSLNEVTAKILHRCTVQTHGDVGPSHTRHALPIQLVFLPVNNIFEIKDARIVVILTWENRLVYVRWVQIGERVLVRIPATKAHVQAAHKGSSAIDQAEFLVVSPVENDILVHSIQSLECVL
jgi:hypothetical protein